MTELVTVQRLMNLVNTMLEARDKDVISAFEDPVVRLPAGGCNTTEFDITQGAPRCSSGSRAMLAR